MGTDIVLLDIALPNCYIEEQGDIFGVVIVCVVVALVFCRMK